MNTQHSSRIPTLDGWRGIAIILVLFDHTMNALWREVDSPWMRSGQHGVTLFFVLSGFLISSNLLSGPVNLKRFYIRRVFRLMPVAWTYLAVLLLINTRVHVISAPAVVSSLFFYRNFVVTAFGSSTWHFWSLSLEEQFYLVWPPVLLLAGARCSRWIAITAISGCALYRWVYWNNYNRDAFYSQTQVRADALLIGCLLALLLSNPELRVRIGEWSGILALPSLCVLVYCIGKFNYLPPLMESASMAVLLAASTLHAKSPFAKPLTWGWLSQLGVVSYSFYVWQELFMLIARGESGLGRLLLLGCLLPICALGSFFFLERPLTALGHKLSDRLTNATAVPPRPLAQENEWAS